MHKMLTQEYLKQILHYDPDTGIWVWFKLNSKAHSIKIGQQAGGISSSHGYKQIRINGKLYLAHRLAWLYMTGQWPKDQIDHINGIRIDSRWNNLREATSSQNRINTDKRFNNKSGYKGVCWHKDHKKWITQIETGGRNILIGYFTQKEQAAKAYNEAALKYHGEFARLNDV